MGLPAPRIQLRWAIPTEAELAGSLHPLDREGRWICHHELVLPLREHDIRREDGDGNRIRSELVLKVDSTIRTSRETRPCDAPFRSGAHAQWDAEALGGLPVIVLDPLGVAHTAKGDRIVDLSAGAA